MDNKKPAPNSLKKKLIPLKKKLTKGHRFVPKLVEEGGAEGESNAGWLVTYSDFISLLLCIFILLNSYSQADLNKFKTMMDSLGKVFDSPKFRDQKDRPVLNEGGNSISFDTLIQKIQDSVVNQIDNSKDIKKYLEVIKTVNGVIVRVEGQLFFNSASANINSEAYPILDLIEKVLRNTDYKCFIEGHTDGFPIQTFKYESNWELSSARASSVLRYLIEKKGIPPKRLAATGYADTIPIANNRTEFGRSKNRRVEFFFTRENTETRSE